MPVLFLSLFIPISLSSVDCPVSCSFIVWTFILFFLDSILHEQALAGYNYPARITFCVLDEVQALPTLQQQAQPTKTNNKNINS